MKRNIIAFCVLVSVLMICGPYLMPKLATFLNNKAVESLEDGQTTQALKLFKYSLKLFEDAKVFCNLANAYRSQGMQEEATEYYIRAIGFDPEYPESYFGLAYLYEEIGMLDEAAGYLERVKELDVERSAEDTKRLIYRQVVELYNQAADYYEVGNAYNADLKLREVVALDPTFAFAYKTIGDIAFTRNLFAEAIKNYKLAIGAGLTDAQIYNVYNDIGIAYIELNALKEAVKYLQQASSIEPDNITILYNLASTLRDNEDYARALNDYKYIARLSPDYPNVHNDIGGIYEALGKKELAIEEFNKEIKVVGSQNVTAHSVFDLNRLAFAYNGLGECLRALGLVNKALALDSEYLEAYFTRSHIYDKLGKTMLARQDLERAGSFIGSSEINKKDMLRIEPSEQKNDSSKKFVEDILVYLNNGRKIKGRLKDEDEKSISLEVLVGSSRGTVTMQKKDVLQMELLQ